MFSFVSILGGTSLDEEITLLSVFGISIVDLMRFVFEFNGREREPVN